ncbi:hypothetical protein [Clostridium sp. 1xD42-85]|uniref:hypothetical protein n=1 Tax=Clostridium sp. 1xD42-85 TaxID=2320084 RepID=UPI001A9B208C|nr:hypothetical protein [Clostridium sp. 1xD42-85]
MEVEYDNAIGLYFGGYHYFSNAPTDFASRIKRGANYNVETGSFIHDGKSQYETANPD